ncbi:gamma-glutamylcyclotransferase [Pontibaca salina]|uniref:glutathione-specific gamma-glutamylcyclotransferase n=1 Tax=Pontibaca salina TaxID=2795731 RepID=A0A934M0P2_9RHOB|nr:gamma-glutamylcyclotransferase [Pontibaca salina]MBI6628856.1 gamma-glutamylcyclotransferase [Pontibaca salina]
MTMWVFGYGSLLWNPGFKVTRRVVATLPGYHRSFCMRSIHHRGTAEVPGLVLALDAAPDVSCIGMALAVAPGQEAQTLEYLRARELISSAYLERVLTITLEDGTEVGAVTYVIDPTHEQYCKDLSLEDQAHIIARAVGEMGPNTEYLYNTADHLAEVGLHDPDLDWLTQRVRGLAGQTLGV